MFSPPLRREFGDGRRAAGPWTWPMSIYHFAGDKVAEAWVETDGTCLLAQLRQP